MLIFLFTFAIILRTDTIRLDTTNVLQIHTCYSGTGRNSTRKLNTN